MKDPVYFVIDDVAVGQTVAQLKEFMLGKPNLTWAALVDGAFDYPDGGKAPYFHTGVNCFEASQFEGLRDAAPWLVPIRRDEGVAESLSALIRHCQGRPMLSFVATTMELADLRARWSLLHWVKVIDDQKMLLRFADTRVLPHLPGILSKPQWASLSGGVEEWIYFDRTGTLRSCATVTDNLDSASGIALEKEQLDLLLEASHPDAMMALILESMPEIVPANAKRSEIFEMVRGADELAGQHGVSNESDIFSLAVAACLTSGESNSSTSMMARLLAGQRWEPGCLGELLVERNIV